MERSLLNNRPMQIFALTTRGLEALSAHEIAGLAGLRISAIGYRQVQASCDQRAGLGRLLSLRTVDDVFIDLAHWAELGRPRSTLETIRRRAAALDLDAALAACATLRPIRHAPVFSTTASFVGRRNYSSDEIKQALADGIASSYGWRYSPDDAEADLNIRMFIEHEAALVGLRLAQRPLQERSYKQAHLPGSLKPPVAAGLALLAEAHDARLLDPCCGAGTILIEAALQGAQAQGGDIRPAALAAAEANARAAGVSVTLQQWDARSLPLPDASLDCVISNLPWGRQIVVDAALIEFYRRAVAEMQRVLVPGGRLVLLTQLPELLGDIEIARRATIEISLFGQSPTISVFQTPQPAAPPAPLPGAEYQLGAPR